LEDPLGYTPSSLGMTVVALRLLAAALLGAMLGFERERHDRPAGLRTYTLVALAACLFTLVTLEISRNATIDDKVVTDPIRVVNAVTSGVAFLAAGTIISQGRRVIGVTTGAGMWMAGAIGVACGAGYYPAAALTCALTLGVLAGLRFLEGKEDKGPPADD
jgi:putative Mg2+ transporter-C (MgtC) family protein